MNLMTRHFEVEGLEGDYSSLDTIIKRFEKAYAEAKTDEERDTAIRNFAYNFSSASAQQVTMKLRAACQFFSNELEIPGGFAGVVMTTLFAGSDAANKMIDSNFSTGEKGSIMVSMKSISMNELDQPWYAGAERILNAIIDDTKSLGGDKSYQIDIGV